MGHFFYPNCIALTDAKIPYKNYFFNGNQISSYWFQYSLWLNFSKSRFNSFDSMFIQQVGNLFLAWIGGACLFETVASVINLLLKNGFCFFSNCVRKKNCTIESTTQNDECSDFFNVSGFLVFGYGCCFVFSS